MALPMIKNGSEAVRIRTERSEGRRRNQYLSGARPCSNYCQKTYNGYGTEPSSRYDEVLPRKKYCADERMRTGVDSIDIAQVVMIIRSCIWLEGPLSRAQLDISLGTSIARAQQHVQHFALAPLACGAIYMARRQVKPEVHTFEK